jgi:hypothetical protein
MTLQPFVGPGLFFSFVFFLHRPQDSLDEWLLYAIPKFATYLIFLRLKYFTVYSVFKRFYEYLGSQPSFFQVKGPIHVHIKQQPGII